MWKIGTVQIFFIIIIKVEWMGKALWVQPSCKVWHLSYLQCLRKLRCKFFCHIQTNGQPAVQTASLTLIITSNHIFHVGLKTRNKMSWASIFPYFHHYKSWAALLTSFMVVSLTWVRRLRCTSKETTKETVGLHHYHNHPHSDYPLYC